MDDRLPFRVGTSLPFEGRAVVALAGEIDLFTAPHFDEALVGVIDAGARRVVVDLSEVTFIDSTAVGVVIGGVRRLRAVGGAIDIVCPSENIRRILELVGLDRVVTIHASRQEALSAA
jgi:anti-sigma B factor antagonist